MPSHHAYAKVDDDDDDSEHKPLTQPPVSEIDGRDPKEQIVEQLAGGRSRIACRYMPATR